MKDDEKDKDGERMNENKKKKKEKKIKKKEKKKKKKKRKLDNVVRSEEVEQVRSKKDNHLRMLSIVILAIIWKKNLSKVKSLDVLFKQIKKRLVLHVDYLCLICFILGAMFCRGCWTSRR